MRLLMLPPQKLMEKVEMLLWQKIYKEKNLILYLHRKYNLTLYYSLKEIQETIFQFITLLKEMADKHHMKELEF